MFTPKEQMLNRAKGLIAWVIQFVQRVNDVLSNRANGKKSNVMVYEKEWRANNNRAVGIKEYVAVPIKIDKIYKIWTRGFR